MSRKTQISLNAGCQCFTLSGIKKLRLAYLHSLFISSVRNIPSIMTPPGCTTRGYSTTYRAGRVSRGQLAVLPYKLIMRYRPPGVTDLDSRLSVRFHQSTKQSQRSCHALALRLRLHQALSLPCCTHAPFSFTTLISNRRYSCSVPSKDGRPMN
ncbi:hypothetical protein M404DRAFT_531472 [Pisolithus tinctorius Marx 270]|uniref:Uncharacterized protein n=1 Tax=Pisolithus tinctorius Marx 270 TaxID=870435 RepID=A0A0C3J7I3_PISTI|nr:hypothetical protein M404DRAFT_531472 [Pisolithus tinctorius Marx 270]